MKFKSTDKVFFTSDTHYGHANICSATTTWDLNDRKAGCRFYDSIEAMNDAIVENINRVVPEDAILFHLGDWSFGGKDNIKIFRERLNCQRIHLIFGNHDQHIEKGFGAELFESVQHYKRISCEGTQIILSHYPIADWENVNRGSIMLHGHQHNQYENHFTHQGRRMDVGYDTWNAHCGVVSLQRIYEDMMARDVVKIHHD
jgi:calcineurin-like phosphoesterase family protein